MWGKVCFSALGTGNASDKRLYELYSAVYIWTVHVTSKFPGISKLNLSHHCFKNLKSCVRKLT